MQPYFEYYSLTKKKMKSLIGKSVKMNFEFPLDTEVFLIVGERINEIEICGDFSAGTNNVSQSEWQPKDKIKSIISKKIQIKNGVASLETTEEEWPLQKCNEIK